MLGRATTTALPMASGGVIDINDVNIENSIFDHKAWNSIETLFVGFLGLLFIGILAYVTYKCYIGCNSCGPNPSQMAHNHQHPIPMIPPPIRQIAPTPIIQAPYTDVVAK